MYLKIDVSFYETETFTGEIPSLALNNDLFMEVLLYKIQLQAILL